LASRRNRRQETLGRDIIRAAAGDAAKAPRPDDFQSKFGDASGAPASIDGIAYLRYSVFSYFRIK